MPNLINPPSSFSAPIQLSGLTGGYTTLLSELNSTSHPADIYSFTTTSASNLNISLKDLTGNAKVNVTKAGDPQFALNAFNSDTLSESIIKNDLAAGTYYVEVSLEDKTSQTNYTLSVLTSLTANLNNIYWRNEGDPQYSTGSWQMDGATLAQGSFSSKIPADWKVAGSGDFNNDGIDDLVWVNQGNGAERGQVAVWVTDGFIAVQTGPGGTGFVSALGAPPAKPPNGWEIKAIADFNGDGKSDLLWYNTATREGAVWQMDGCTLVKGDFLRTLPPGWTIEAVADFDGPAIVNGVSVSKADILWRNAATGEAAIWLMNGTAPGTGTNFIKDPGQIWQVVGTGDFNGDKKADLVWRNTLTGRGAIWLMDGIKPSSGTDVLPDVGLDWNIAGIGDTNGDGKSDLFLRNSVSNALAVWVMDGAAVQPGTAGTATLAASPDANWQVAVKNKNFTSELKNNQKALVDLNNDGKVDLFWRNLSTKELAVWTLDGGKIGAGGARFITGPNSSKPVELGTEWQNVAFLERKLKQVPQSTAGTSPATAFNLGTIVGDVGTTTANNVVIPPASYVDNVGSAGNSKDYYKFTVTSDYLVGPIAPVILTPGAAASSKLLTETDTAGVKTYKDYPQKAGEPIPPGTYIIEVTPGGTTAVDYKLNISFVQAVVELSGAPAVADQLKTGFSVAYPTGTSAITLLDVGNDPKKPITTPVDIKYKVQNTGSYSASNVKVVFYLSKADGGVIDPTDRYDPVNNKTGKNLKLGEATIPTIPALSTNAGGDVTFQLPAGDDSFWNKNGTYEIGMVINPTGDSTYTPKKETDPNNNFNIANGRDKSTLEITNVQRPDLKGLAVGVAGNSATKGADTLVNFTIANVGKKGTNGLSPNFDVSFYLSATPVDTTKTFDPTVATLLQTYSYDNLISPLGKAGSTDPTFPPTITTSTTLTIPTTFTGTSGYLVMYVDGPTNAVNEVGVVDPNDPQGLKSGENNNVLVSSQITIA